MTVLAAIGFLILGLHLATAVLCMIQLNRRLPATGQAPEITLIRPVCGVDPFDEMTLGSSFRLSPPAAEILFCAASESDAAVPLVRRLIADNPRANARLLVGEQRISGNPKLNNVARAWDRAAHDWIAMADSNLMLPPDYLATLSAAWTPGTGLVSSPAWGWQPRGMAARVEAAVLNGNQARVQLAAAALDAGFAQGKTLFFNRRILNKAGGLAVLGRELAEDVAATKAIRGLGLKVRLVPRPFAQPIGRRSWRAVWDRQLRWSRVRRAGFPALFLLEPLNGPFLPALMVLPMGVLPALAVIGLWYAAEAILALRAGWPMGPADLAASVIRDLMLPAIWVATFARPGFTWRGNDMAPAKPAE